MRSRVVYAVVTVVLATIWLWPHLANPRQLPDRGDPVFSAWRLARFAHQLRHDPAHLFDGNIFYPRPATLAYSDATVLEGIAGAPFILAGADPLLVSNALFFLAFPLCGLAFFVAGRRLTGSAMAGLVAGVLGAWYPFHAEHYSHLELQWFMFVPLAFVAVLDTIADPTWRKGAALAVLIAAQFLASMYFGLMLLTVLIPTAAVAFMRSQTSSRRLLPAVATAVAVLLPVLVLLAVPYQRARSAHGERSVDEVVTGSAMPSDYLRTSRRLAAYSWHSRALNRPERELYPGTSTIVLAGIGLLTLPLDTALPLAAAGVAAFDWSLGLNGVSYRWLRALLPPYRSIRVPARFAALLGAVLILLAAHGAHALVRHGGMTRQVVTTALVIAVILFDLRVKVELVDYYPEIPSVYNTITASAVLAELPTGREADYMYFSTRHWANLLSGYSGFIAPDAGLAADLTGFPSPESIAGLHARGATHLVYNCAFERSVPRCDRNLADLAANPQLELQADERWQGASVRLYRFR